jgi:hypothetical protein
LEVEKVPNTSGETGPTTEQQSDKCQLFIIEQVLSHRKFRNETQYLIKFEGYSEEENEWLPAKNIMESDILFDYWSSLGDFIPIQEVPTRFKQTHPQYLPQTKRKRGREGTADHTSRRH